MIFLFFFFWRRLEDLTSSLLPGHANLNTGMSILFQWTKALSCKGKTI